MRGRQLARGTLLLAEVLAGVMMQVPGAFAAPIGAPRMPVTSFPHQAATPWTGGALERYWDLAVLCDLFLVRDRGSSLVPRRG